MSSEMVLPARGASTTADESAPAARQARGRRIVVVYVIDNMRLGGTELNAVRTAERLDRERFELRVVCLKDDGPLTERYRAMGVPVTNLGLRSFYGPSMIRSGWRFVRLLRRARADIVHAHDVYSNIFVMVWARLAGVRAVIASRRWWHSLPNRGLQLVNRVAFSRADAVLANSGQVAHSVLTEAHVPPDRIVTITNFVAESAFEPLVLGERDRIRHDWGVPSDAVVVGCVARLVPVKNHAMLLQSVARLRAANLPVHAVLIGDGESRASLEQMTAELGLSHAVRFVGELRDGANHHRAFDISVLCSLSEGFPNTIVEAMAAGRPVVATAVGGNSDAVIDGETGLLVPSGDVPALTAALERLVREAGARTGMGEAGRDRARALYHEKGVLESVEQMYDRLVGAAS